MSRTYTYQELEKAILNWGYILERKDKNVIESTIDLAEVLNDIKYIKNTIVNDIRKEIIE